MDPATLAAAAATALIAAITTDAWQQAQTAVVGLWRRVHPSRARTIMDELGEVRQDALIARRQGDANVEAGLEADWQRRLARLLDADPGIAQDLQNILNNVLTPMIDRSDKDRVEKIVMKAQASGHGKVYQAGRDMRITEK